MGLPPPLAAAVIETPPSLTTVPVDLGPKSYPVRIGPGALGLLGEEILARGFRPGDPKTPKPLKSRKYLKIQKMNDSYAALILPFLKTNPFEDYTLVDT